MSEQIDLSRCYQSWVPQKNIKISQSCTDKSILSAQIHENPYSDKLEHHFVNATQDDVRWDPLMDPSSIQNEQDGGSLASRNQNRLLLLKRNDQKIVTITYDLQTNTSNSVLVNFIFIGQELLKIHDQ